MFENGLILKQKYKPQNEGKGISKKWLNRRKVKNKPRTHIALKVVILTRRYENRVR